MHGSQRVLEIADAAVALVAFRIGEPGLLLAPVDDLVGLPHIGAPAAEAECLEAHGFERDIAGKDHEIGPGDLRAVFPLDGPQEPARLVEVRIVRPGAERCEALLAGAGAAAPVADAVRARGVPRHANHEPAVVAEIRRPPVLAVRHQRGEVLLQGGVIELLELVGVVESLAHGIGLGRVRAENPEVQLQFGHQSLFDLIPTFVVPCTTGHLPAFSSILVSMFSSDRVSFFESLDGSKRVEHLSEAADRPLPGLGERLEPVGELVDAFLAGNAGHARIHVDIFVGLAGDRGLEDVAGRTDRLAGRRVARLPRDSRDGRARARSCARQSSGTPRRDL